MTPRPYIIAILLAGLFFLNGCRHCSKRSQCSGPGTGGPPPGAPFLGSGPNTLPPQNIPIDPTPGINARSSPEVLLPAPVPPGTSSYPPRAAAPKRDVFLGDPDFAAVAPAVSPAIEEKKSTVKMPPLATIEENPSSPLPVGIANYAQVKEGVNTGLRPDLLDGFDWLQSKGFKTVLFLRNGKDDDSSDREQVTKRGMKYLTLTVTPETIKPDSVVEFNRIVNDTDGRPVFVYDTSGTQSGAMWYLYFRTSELLNNDESLVRAGRHGLKEKGDLEQTRLMTAVQKYLSERNP